jgi:hypothetical protein
MDPGFTLTYKDLAPVYFLKGSRANTPVDPAGAN